MKRIQRSVIFVAMSLFLILATESYKEVASAASIRGAQDCESGFGANVPVLMVHGWNSDSSMWSDGSPSMVDALSKVAGVAVNRPFDYQKSNLQWVTDANIGPRLAETIDCLAQNSKKSGGKGKVIVVAHSMGGLATRFAASQVVNNRRVADELGLVVTLGTPYVGSLWGNAGTSVATTLCQDVVGTLLFNPLLGILMTKDECLGNQALKALGKDSRELQELPPFPPNVPVRAIAGNARVYVQFLFSEFAKTGTSSDLLVGTESALVGGTQTGRGDGKVEFKCDVRRYVSNKQWQGGECTHNELYKTGYIQESVRKGIEEYLAATSRPVTNFFSLGLNLGSEWEVLGKKDDPSTGNRKVVIKKGCDPQRYRLYCDGFVVVKMQATNEMPYRDGTDCYSSVFDDWGWGPPEVVHEVIVDGVKGEYFRQQQCQGNQGDVQYGWRFPSRGVVVFDSLPYNSQPFPGLPQLIESAIWQ